MRTKANTNTAPAPSTKRRQRLPRRKLQAGQRWVRMEDGEIGVEISVPLDADELEGFQRIASDLGETVEGLAKSIARSAIGIGRQESQRQGSTVADMA